MFKKSSTLVNALTNTCNTALSYTFIGSGAVGNGLTGLKTFWLRVSSFQLLLNAIGP